MYLRTVILNGTDWKEYVYTFVSPKDVQGNSWIGLLVGLSDVDFWFDDIRFFEGEPFDEIKGNSTAIRPLNRIVLTWASIKKVSK